MIEIKNPHSRKRLNLKEKFNKKFTEFIVPYLEKIPLDENWNAKSKFIPKVLEIARVSVKGWERDIWTTEIPKDIELDLLAVYVAEFIPIENVDKLNKGLKKLIRKYPVKFGYVDAERVDEFCNDVKKSIHGGRWSNFGFINLDNEENIKDIVEKIHIQGTHLSSSSIIIQFVITPSDKFVREYKKLIESDIKSGHSFNLTFKNLFKFWGGGSLAVGIVKKQMLEDLIIELKWRTMKEISKFFELYFTNNKMIPPSIEVYKIKQLSCNLSNKENEKLNDFWRSVGMDSPLSDISKDGYWQLFSDGRDSHLIDSSLKVSCNAEVKREPMFHSLDFQIVYLLQEFAESILPVMVMRDYTVDTSKKIAMQQNKTFSSNKKENPKYQKLINVRYELEQNLQLLKRFKNEIGENYFDTAKVNIKKIVDFEPSRPRFINMSCTEMIVDNTSYIVDKTYKHSQHFAKIIDDTVKLLEIKTNNSLRKTTFFLTITTVLLSIIATTIASISLFIQLDDETKDYLHNLIAEFINFFL